MQRTIKKYEIEEDGIVYIVEEGENGAIAKYEKPSDEYADLITEKEQAQLEMQSNIEYLVALEEMNMEV